MKKPSVYNADLRVNLVRRTHKKELGEFIAWGVWTKDTKYLGTIVKRKRERELLTVGYRQVRPEYWVWFCPNYNLVEAAPTRIAIIDKLLKSFS